MSWKWKTCFTCVAGSPLSHHTRLDCAVGSAALMRQCARHAALHCAGRVAFGRPLLEQPLMRAVVADLAVETEAANGAWQRVARAFDAGEDDFARLATPLAKYWLCKRAPAVAAEAMECLGGNGYVEAHGAARRYRQAPLNSIWEGSGNVIALDLLRALRRHPAARAAFLGELARARGADARLDGALDALPAALDAVDERGARSLADRLAVAFQAATLVRHGDGAIAEAYCATRLASTGVNFGARLCPPGAEARAIERLLL